MPTPIDFYFDFSSPYGYFAAHRIDAIAKAHGRTVEWHPILLGLVFEVSGGRPLPTIPMKGDYARVDVPRAARFHGIAYAPPAKFPVSGQAACRAFYWLAAQDAARAQRLALALFHAYFADGRDISSPQVTVDVAAEMGVPGPALAAALSDPAVKEVPRSATQQAISRGVFGSPYFIVDGEPFWGNDRLDQVERWLASGPF
ncbi:MAG: 2-hydroxychromene-2-carboxylate isomerase [bacterium]|jgi:2-hydroxychromene-2-carboxylate isomerase|nr:2-hydroxychromene-2-carboxylate isomerase [Betaproteobacteria bacterium]